MLGRRFLRWGASMMVFVVVGSMVLVAVKISRGERAGGDYAEGDYTGGDYAGGDYAGGNRFEPEPIPIPIPVVTDPPVVDHDGCPTEPRALLGRSGHDAGPLVQRKGVVAITLCELGAVERTGYPAEFGKPRTLTRNVAAMVALLNELPDKAQTEVIIGRAVPDSYMACQRIDFFSNYAFSVRYPDRTVVVLMDVNCGLLHSAGRTRYATIRPMDRFLAWYREQLAETTPAATIGAPACAPDMVAADLKLGESNATPLDGIGRNRGDGDPYLPSPLAVITACRYEDSAGLLALTHQRTVRGRLATVHGLLTQATSRETKQSDCGDLFTYIPWVPPSTLDVLWVADVTGAVSEFRIWRAPCTTVRTINIDSRVPSPQLLAELDRWLS